MEKKKTDMLTVEQFNEAGQIKKSNCLGFAIGVSEQIELEYEDISIDDSFAKRLSEYGMIVKKVESLEELKGKTGFIVYGFYDMPISLFGMSYTEKNDFHVVRVNPDGSLVHKQDAREPAKHVPLLSSRGGIEEYNAPNEPIHIFSLEEERHIDKTAVVERTKMIFSETEKILNNPLVSETEKDKIRQEVENLRGCLDGSANSNIINIMLQKIEVLVRDRQSSLDDDAR